MSDVPDATRAAPQERRAFIEGQEIAKSFGGVRALHGASFAADAGEVHALVGENGAGKSTMIKILSGVLRPDAGTVLMKGRPVELSGPEAARALGMRTVFQDLTLLPWLTVAENLLLGREPRRAFGLIDGRAMEAQAARTLAEIGIVHIDPLDLIADLSLADRQIVEIARAVVQEPDVLFLDEPTSSLAQRETEWLFGLIRQLRARNKCIIFTSHRWAEVKIIADRITIFRNGERVGVYTDIGEDEAITLMTGRRVDTMYPKLPPLAVAAPALELRSVTTAANTDVSWVLHKGEILGIGGLAGSGHRELFLALFGAEKITGGQVLVNGRPVKIRSPRDAIRHGLGIALVPEDRKREGLLLPMAVKDNLTLAVLHWISLLGVVKRGVEGRLTLTTIEELQIRTPSANQPVGALSGGNQQKVLIGRWLLAQSRILLYFDITRGVDIATKHDLYELMLRLVQEGRSILFYSSDTEELARLSHRVLVMREGKIAAELVGPDIDAEAIVAAAVRSVVAA